MLFFVILIPIILILGINYILVYFKKNIKTFKLNKQSETIDIIKRLKNLIEEKLKNRLVLSGFIPQKDFEGLHLIEAPVYIIDKSKLGGVHLKMYQKAIEEIHENLNFVVLNGRIEVNNRFINLICVDEKKLNIKEWSILRSLNINFVSKKKFEDNLDFVGLKNGLYDENLTGRIGAELNDYMTGKFRLKPYFKYYYVLPKRYFGYFLKGNKNRTVIFDAFGEKLMSFHGKFGMKLKDNVIVINSFSNELNFTRFYEKKFVENLELLSLEIKYPKFEREITELKGKIKGEISKNLFAIPTEIKEMNIRSLQTFFKVAKLRQIFISDYLFLLTKVFGISIKNGLMIAKPSKFIDEDFSICYNYNGQRCSVNFSFARNDGKILNQVAHKLGTKEKFLLGI